MTNTSYISLGVFLLTILTRKHWNHLIK
jgi:hypothetical protein